MTPAVFAWQVVLDVLGIVNQQVNAAAEFHPLFIGRLRSTRRVQLIVSDIGNGNAVFFNTIRITTTWVVQILLEP